MAGILKLLSYVTVLIGFLLLGAMSATAATVQVIYSGTIQTGVDRGGFFGGSAGQIIDGLRFQLTYFFDPSIGGFNYGGPNFDDPIFNFSYGGHYTQVGVGEYDYGANPSLGAVLHIEGLPTDVVFTGTYAFMFAHNASGMSGQSHGISVNSSIFINAQIQASHAAIPASLVGPFSYDLTSEDYFDGVFQLSAGSGSAYSFGRMTITNLRVEPLVTTPLPATLALFVTGLCTLGLLAQRRPQRNRAMLS